MRANERWRQFGSENFFAFGHVTAATKPAWTSSGSKMKESGNLPIPTFTHREIVEDLEAAFEQFRAADLGADVLIEKDLHFVLIVPKRGLSKILRPRAS
jgi:hypothetical protein